MKRIISLIIVSLVIVTEQAWANPISKEQARRNVEAFLKERGKSVAIQQPSGVRHKQSPKPEKEALYIFNLGNKEGYVVASGDDCAPAVLGYSTIGEYDAEKAPENMKAWLEEYKNQIEFMQRNGIVSVREASTDYPAIKPLLTTKWDQGDPYNISCPDFFDTGSKCVTGCVATAMAQILYFHRKNSVNETQMQLPGYPCATYWVDYGYLKVQSFPKNSPINWDFMLDSYDGSETEMQIKAVADLMAYCGSSVHMEYRDEYDFGSSSSSSRVPSALKNVFKYNENTEIVNRNDYAKSDWDNLIYNQLKRGMPVFYSGFSTSGMGHAFVCDGYDADGYFHINWGWSGTSDDYYRLSALYPKDQGAGSTGEDYNLKQSAIIEARPAGDEVKLATSSLSLTGRKDFIKNIFKGPISIPIRIVLQNKTKKRNFVSAFALYSKGIRTEIINEQDINISDSKVLDQQLEIDIMSIPLEGVYQIIPISRETNTDYWYKNENSDEKYITLVVKGDNVSLFDSSTNKSQDIISFADIEAKRMCVENWDTDGDREISYDEARNVTGFNYISNSLISTFNEAQYFTGIKEFSMGSCPNLLSLTIPQSVIEIADYGLYGCPQLNNLEIPNSVTKLGSSSFRRCRSLEKIVLPYRLVSIGEKAFEGCSTLSSVFIPASVKTIGQGAFGMCRGMSEITVSENNTTYLSIEGVLYTKDKKILVQLPAKRFGSYVIPEGTETITQYALHGALISEVSIPKSIKTIDKSAFQDCNLIQKVVCYSDTPCVIEKSVFSGIDSNAILYVPSNSISAYKKANYWKDFFQILSIEDINVDKRSAQTLTLTSLPKMAYGDYNYMLPRTTNEGLQLVWSCDGDAASILGNYLIVKNAGNATIVASQEGNTQYQPFSRSFTLTINKAKLTVTAKSYSKKQFEANPTFEAEYSGFKYNDTEKVLTKKPVFVCSATATSGAGKYAINVSGAEARNYEMTYVNGVLTVTEAGSNVKRGDVNNDGEVDVADVVATVNYILGRSSAGFVVAAANINGDKAIDVADVVGMVNIILGRNAARSVEKNEAEAMENDVLALDCGFGNRFALSLENQGRYVAAQFDVELSDGLEIESVTLNKARFVEHRVAYAQIGERLYRVMVYSMDGTAIGGERGEILAMQLSGNGAFRIKDIAFVTSVLGVKRFADLQNGTTGIRSLETGRPVDVYGIDGRLIRRQTTDLKGLKKGVYVVDGQKVVVK